MKVYLIESNLNGEISYKIGKTNRQAFDRLKELQTGNAGKLKILYEYESNNASIIEKTFHSIYCIDKINGEWFFNQNIPSNFIKMCENIDNNIKILKTSENPFI